MSKSIEYILEAIIIAFILWMAMAIDKQYADYIMASVSSIILKMISFMTWFRLMNNMANDHR